VLASIVMTSQTLSCAAAIILTITVANADGATCESLLAFTQANTAITSARLMAPGPFTLPSGPPVSVPNPASLGNLPAFCRGGEGPNTFDAIGTLDRWAEKRQAPDRIDASPATGGTIDRTRPLCAYPQVARYNGTGSVDDAANFTCRAPR